MSFVYHDWCPTKFDTTMTGNPNQPYYTLDDVRAEVGSGTFQNTPHDVPLQLNALPINPHDAERHQENHACINTTPSQHPVIGNCQINALVPVIGCASTQPKLQKVDLMAAYMPQQAYIVSTDTSTRRNLMFNRHCWAEEILAFRIPKLIDGSRSGPCIFAEPMSGIVEPVTIRRINKSTLLRCRAHGMPNDPYNDLWGMQTIGNGTNVLECIEALQDDTFLYIITPLVKDKLSNWISAGKLVTEDQAKLMFAQILENLRYLRAVGFCHANLTPDNIIVCSNGRVVLSGLDRSFRLPNHGCMVHTTTMGFSTNGSLLAEYVPPEVYVRLPFDAHTLDLWSSVVVLFRLLTGGGTLYRTPTDEDPLFRYFILARGIASDMDNELLAEAFASIDDPREQAELSDLVEKYRLLSPEVVDVFDAVLRVPLLTRWKLNDVATSSWMLDKDDDLETIFD
jgi:serine/threonine protein kinase